jgi:GAG-pre-integrase domain
LEDGDVNNPIDLENYHKILRSKMNSESDLLLYHHRLGHVSFSKLQDMARLGMIPQRLAKARIPLCPSCMYGKLSRRPWRTKYDYHPISNAELPGQFISVDQMESTTPGLIAQMKGIPTRERYHYVTIFCRSCNGIYLRTSSTRYIFRGDTSS